MSGSESDFESEIDSDTELQRKFAEGRLKPGLHRLKQEAPAKSHINNVDGMQEKLKDIQQPFTFPERLDVTCDPVAAKLSEDEVNDDFKLEMTFYRQAQAAVLFAIPKLKAMDVPTKRPPDFFAEMAKPDHHMKKIREKLMERKVALERSEAAKKLREAKKFGKKVQQEVALKRQQEKRELGEAVKKYRKGKANQLDEILEGKKTQVNKKRQKKNHKFGFGGQKKRSKRNTKESMDTPWKKSAKGSSFKPGQGRNKPKPNRPGKARRKQNKNRGK